MHEACSRLPTLLAAVALAMLLTPQATEQRGALSEKVEVTHKTYFLPSMTPIATMIFEEVSQDAPSPGGGHAMLLVGYDMTTRSWLVRNSWGEDFADRGYLDDGTLAPIVANNTLYILHDSGQLTPWR